MKEVIPRRLISLVGTGQYDIRNWHPGREKCGKGITLTEEETHALMDALKEVFGEEE